MPCWGLQGAGDGVISLGALSHYQPEQLLLSEAVPPSSFAFFLCLSQLWGPARQPLAVVVAAGVAMSRWDSFPCLRKPTASVFLWGRMVAPWWGGSLVGVCKATSSPLLAVGCFSVAPGSVWLLHTHEVPVWDVEEQQQLGPACGRLWQSRCHPSLKNTLYTAESSSPWQGFEPSSATRQSGGDAGTGAMLLGNVPLGAGRGISGHAGAAPRSRSRGRSSAGHSHSCLVPSQGLSLCSCFMASPGKAPGMKSNPSACVLACRAQSSVKLFSHPWSCSWMLKGLGAGGAAWQ